MSTVTSYGQTDKEVAETYSLSRQLARSRREREQIRRYERREMLHWAIIALACIVASTILFVTVVTYP